MTPPRPGQPATSAGRALLDALPLNEWHPMNTEFVIDHILAIEAEAASPSAGLRAALERLARQYHGLDTIAHKRGSWTHCDNRWCEYARAALASGEEGQ